MKMGRGRRSWRATGAVALLAVLAAACNSGVDPLSPSLGAAVITRASVTEAYGVVEDGAGVVTVTARPENTDANIRVLFWRQAETVSAAQETCATWSASDHDQQPGLALRIHDVNGGTRAITVTKNVWFFAWSVFNVHVMDSSNPNAPFVQIAGQDLPGLRLSESFNDVKPYPWRACARVVGSTVSVKVWPVNEPEPAWNDPNYGYSVTLPASANVTSGRPGHYAGHVLPGRSLTYSDLVATNLDTPVRSRAAAETLAEPTVPPLDPTHIVRAP
jgi:hypothetical protein